MKPPTITLSTEDRQILRIGARAMRDIDLGAHPDAWLSGAESANACLSTPLRTALDNFGRHGNREGVLLLRGIPLGDIPATPTHAHIRAHPPRAAAAALGIVVSGIGHQYGYAAESDGSLIQNVCPQLGSEHDQISGGSMAQLDLHVELAFLESRPDHIALLCLRADRDGGAETTVSRLDEVIALLDEDTLARLRAERFRTGVDLSFRRHDPSTPTFSGRIALIAGHGPRTTWRLDHASVEALDSEARHALATLLAAVASTKTGIKLTRGDLLLLDNRRTAHGRASFVPHYDGLDRWLLRAFSRVS